MKRKVVSHARVKKLTFTGQGRPPGVVGAAGRGRGMRGRRARRLQDMHERRIRSLP